MVNLPITTNNIRFAIGSPDGLTSNSWAFWASKSGVYLKCRDNFQIAKVSLHTGAPGRPGRWRMGFEDYVSAKYPGIIPLGRDRAWKVWDEPEEQLPNTQIAFKLLFPNLELAVRPEQKTSKEWKKEILYVDLWSRLPAGWMTVATVFVTRGNIRLQHEREPSFWLGSLEIGNGKWAQLVIHGDPELDIYETINNSVSTMLAKAQTAGVQAPSEGFAYMLGQSTEGHRYIIGARTNAAAQAERANYAHVKHPAPKNGEQNHQSYIHVRPEP